MATLSTFFVDAQNGVVIVNGEIVENVSAFSLDYHSGKFSLCVTTDTYLSANSPESRNIAVS